MPEKVFTTNIPPQKRDEDENFKEVKDEEIFMQWDSQEFLQYDRPQSWYIALLGIALLMIVLGVITRNYLLVIIIIILAVVINAITRKKPEFLSVAITQKGVMINNNLYTYEEDLESFWVLYNPPEVKTLNFARQQKFAPQITIQIDQANPLKIREILLEYLTEDIEHEEHIADKVSRRLGF